MAKGRRHSPDQPATSTCEECKCVSTPDKIMHESWCTQGEQARQERGGDGFRTATVDGREAIIVRGKPIELVELTMEQLVGVVADLRDDATAKEKKKKAAQEAHKKALIVLEDATKNLADRYRKEHSGQTTLPLDESGHPDSTPDDSSDNDEEGDDD